MDRGGLVQRSATCVLTVPARRRPARWRTPLPSPTGNRDCHHFPRTKRARSAARLTRSKKEEFRNGPLPRGRRSHGARPGRRSATWRPSATRRSGTRALAAQQLDPGPAGQPLRLVVPFLGVRMSLTYEVIRFVPDREVLLHAANGVLQATDRIVVTGTADGSTVSYDTEVRLRGTLRVLDPVPRPGFRAVAERAPPGCPALSGARVLAPRRHRGHRSPPAGRYPGRGAP